MQYVGCHPCSILQWYPQFAIFRVPPLRTRDEMGATSRLISIMQPQQQLAFDKGLGCEEDLQRMSLSGGSCCSRSCCSRCKIIPGHPDVAAGCGALGECLRHGFRRSGCRGWHAHQCRAPHASHQNLEIFTAQVTERGLPVLPDCVHWPRSSSSNSSSSCNGNSNSSSSLECHMLRSACGHSCSLGSCWTACMWHDQMCRAGTS